MLTAGARLTSLHAPIGSDGFRVGTPQAVTDKFERQCWHEEQQTLNERMRTQPRTPRQSQPLVGAVGVDDDTKLRQLLRSAGLSDLQFSLENNGVVTPAALRQLEMSELLVKLRAATSVVDVTEAHVRKLRGLGVRLNRGALRRRVDAGLCSLAEAGAADAPQDYNFYNNRYNNFYGL